jgi:hypothetical protein
MRTSKHIEMQPFGTSSIMWRGSTQEQKRLIGQADCRLRASGVQNYFLFSLAANKLLLPNGLLMMRLHFPDCAELSPCIVTNLGAHVRW